jgi:hypothetical protein
MPYGFLRKKTKCHMVFRGKKQNAIYSHYKNGFWAVRKRRPVFFHDIWNLGHRALPLTCHVDIDGTYFGTTFPHLFLMTYPHLKPHKPVQQYIPRVFGFKIHKP